MGAFDKKKAFGIVCILTGLVGVIEVLVNMSETIQPFKCDEDPEKSVTTASIVEIVERNTEETVDKQEDIIEVSAVEQVETESVSPTELSTESQLEVVYLDSLKVSESHGFYEDESSAKDTIGNTYIGHILSIGKTETLEDINENDYVLYYLGEKYKILSGTIAIHDRTSDNAIAELFIFCDENVVYSTGQVSRATAPMEFSVSVEGCQWLKISKITYGDKYYAYPNTFILSDFKLE